MEARENGYKDLREERIDFNSSEGGSQATERSEGDSYSTLDYSAVIKAEKRERLKKLLYERDSHENTNVIIRKCRCNSVWCEICGRKVIMKIMSKIYEEWNFRFVRHIILTVDRELFENGREAYYSIQREKRISEAMKKIRKQVLENGLTIKDYDWFLEWHKDGFPHWHLLLFVDKQGKAGQIASKVDFKKIWHFARHVHEEYIRNMNHWNNFVGYASKTGYLEKGKKYQVVLPDWARKKKKTGKGRLRIKRHERMRGNGDGICKMPKYMTNDMKQEWIHKRYKLTDEEYYVPGSGEFFEGDVDDQGRSLNISEEDLTWGEILDRCGSQSEITFARENLRGTFRINIPYSQLKKYGEYMEGQGLIAKVDRRLLWVWLKQTVEIKDIKLTDYSKHLSVNNKEDVQQRLVGEVSK